MPDSIKDNKAKVAESTNNRVYSMSRKLHNRKVRSQEDQGLVELVMDEVLYKKTKSLGQPNTFSRQQENKEGLSILEPEYSPDILKRLPTENNILNQCLEAMVQNIAGTGHHMEYIGPEGQEESTESQEELISLQNFLDCPNEEDTYYQIQKKICLDKEMLGYAFYEVIRDSDSRIISIYHLPALHVRATVQGDEKVPLPDAETSNASKRHKRFRSFVQRDYTGLSKIYFKEFMDPRTMNSVTGEYREDVPVELRASEVLMVSEYACGKFYGVPRWVNQIPSLLGSRESEIVNLEFFRDNAIPAMAVLVSGGSLTQDSVDALANKFNDNRGRDKTNEVLILEASGDGEAASDSGQIPAPKVEMKPLINERQSDALFQEYDKTCRQNIRSSFRLPPIILGLSEDYTHATASASIMMAESQVFQPGRQFYDDVINRKILGVGSTGAKYWAIKSNPLSIVDNSEISKSIDALDSAGALSPNVVIGLANKVFRLQIPLIEEEWGSLPYSMTLLSLGAGKKLLGLEGINSAVSESKDKIKQKFSRLFSKQDKSV